MINVPHAKVMRIKPTHQRIEEGGPHCSPPPSPPASPSSAGVKQMDQIVGGQRRQNIVQVESSVDLLGETIMQRHRDRGQEEDEVLRLPRF